MRPTLPFLAAALLLAALAAWTDVRRGRIPNWLTLPVLAVAPLAHAFLARGQRGVLGMPAPVFAVGWSVAAALASGLVPYLLFKLRVAGAGDAKLLAALGALLLPEVALAAEFSAFAAALFFVPARLAYRGTLWATFTDAFGYATRSLRNNPQLHGAPLALTEQLRLGPFILIGTALSPFVARMPT